MSRLRIAPPRLGRRRPRPADILPERGSAGGLLPWVIAVMVYLAALATASGLALGNAVGEWARDLEGTVTVQILPDPPDIAAGGSAGGPAPLETRLARALEIVRASPGVARAEPLSRTEMSRLLEPWLGPEAALDSLPVPVLIDVTLGDARVADLERLGARLAEEVPGAHLDDHHLWLDRVIRLARSVQLVAGAVVILVALSTVALVIFATRSGLAAHRPIVDLLHMIGARDGFIAREFEVHYLALGLRGGLIGLAVAGVTFIALARFTSELGAPFVPRLALTGSQYLILASLPVAAALVATATAGLTVLRDLRRRL